MNLRPVWALIDLSTDKWRFSILKHLQNQSQLSYTELRSLVGIQLRATSFAYHIRKLKTNGLIRIVGFGKMYKLTERGIEVLKVLDGLKELHISDKADEMCINDNDKTHNWIRVCTNCGIIKKQILERPIRI